MLRGSLGSGGIRRVLPVFSKRCRLKRLCQGRVRTRLPIPESGIGLGVMQEEFVVDNAELWIGDGSSLEGHLIISEGRIKSIGKGAYHGSLPRVDAEGCAISPGLIDLMVLGGFGLSVLKDDPLDIAKAYLKLGVTSCQFCSGNLSWEKNAQIAKNVRQAQAYRGDDAAHVIGIYMEGPFQQPERTGAGLSIYSLPPSRENVDCFQEVMGKALTMINISPSTPGDVEAIKVFRAAGIVVSMAHSDATVEQVLACVTAGTTILGHVFCNNPALIEGGVQQPTVDHIGLTDERIQFVHLICDGIHTAPTMVRLVMRCRGPESVILVTDGIPLSGCPDGNFVWDDGRIFTKCGKVGRTADGDLMGSATLLPDMFRNLIKITGLKPQEAIRTVTSNPAASLGLASKVGLLAEGRRADLVLWDSNLRIRRVWKSGEEVASVSDFAEVTL